MARAAIPASRRPAVVIPLRSVATTSSPTLSTGREAPGSRRGGDGRKPKSFAPVTNTSTITTVVGGPSVYGPGKSLQTTGRSCAGVVVLKSKLKAVTGAVGAWVLLTVQVRPALVPNVS